MLLIFVFSTALTVSTVHVTVSPVPALNKRLIADWPGDLTGEEVLKKEEERKRDRTENENARPYFRYLRFETGVGEWPINAKCKTLLLAIEFKGPRIPFLTPPAPHGKIKARFLKDHVLITITPESGTP